jgi:hypothetical protein
MYKLISILDGRIPFSVNDEARTTAVLEITDYSKFYHSDKEYNLDPELSTDLLLVWRNNLSTFNLSAALGDQFRQIIFQGYYNDGINIYRINMTESYVISFSDYNEIKEVFVNILLAKYTEHKEQKKKQKTLIKSSLAILVGITAYTIFGGLGLLSLPIMMINNNTDRNDRKIITDLMEKNQGKNIFQLSNFNLP